jgi:hypothetical protein
MLLNYAFGMIEESRAIENAVAQSITDGFCTEDLKADGANTTTEVGDYIVKKIMTKELV